MKQRSRRGRVKIPIRSPVVDSVRRGGAKYFWEKWKHCELSHLETFPLNKIYGTVTSSVGKIQDVGGSKRYEKTSTITYWWILCIILNRWIGDNIFFTRRKVNKLDICVIETMKSSKIISSPQCNTLPMECGQVWAFRWPHDVCIGPHLIIEIGDRPVQLYC